MTMWTFGSIASAVLEEIDEDAITEFASSPTSEERRVKRYINLTYQSIFDERPNWSWAQHKDSFTTVSGQSDYEKGAGADDLDTSINMQKFHYLKLSQQAPLELLPFEEFKLRLGNVEGFYTGTPTIATVMGGKLVLFPTPNSASAVEYLAQKDFSQLTTFSEEPLIPDAQRDILYWGALAMAKNHDHEDTIEIQRYNDRLQKLRNAEGQGVKGYRIFHEDDTQFADYERIILLE